ncbi:MAG: hypothetical protein WB799_19435 [Candidatus Sulfotelmatobacter sp.]
MKSIIFALTVGRQFSLMPIAILILASFCLSQPAVQLGPAVGPPTTNVLVSGSGFSADASIDIYFNTTFEASALADGSGSFSNVAIQVPSSAVPGNHWVSAVQLSTDTGAKAVFLVQTNWLQFGFTPDNTRNNPYENVLNASTVASILPRWNAGVLTGGAPRPQ